MLTADYHFFAEALPSAMLKDVCPGGGALCCGALGTAAFDAFGVTACDGWGA